MVIFIIRIIYDKNTTKEKATKVAIEHIRKKRNVDVVVTKVEFLSAFQGGHIEVTGHARNDKQRNFFVTINNNRDYLVRGWNLDDPK